MKTNKKLQSAVEFLIILVFVLVLISVIMYIVGIKSIDIKNQQNQKEIDSFAQKIQNEIKILGKVEPGYYRKIKIQPNFMKRFNLTINSSSSYFTLIDTSTGKNKISYYEFPSNINISLVKTSGKYYILLYKNEIINAKTSNILNISNQLKQVTFTPSNLNNPISSSGSFNGYAWGENFGYISFNGTNYNVSMINNQLTGYAWSENFGYISFNGTNYGVTNNNGNLTGYAFGENCGYISFNGTNYQTTFNGTNLNGYAYNENYGYINFSYPSFYTIIYN